ncbi:MAG: sensor domain-containing protein [Vulcanimicrobiaceae bacterium]
MPPHSDNHDQFRSLFDYNPDGIVIFGADGRVLDVNQAVLNLGDAPREQLLGMHYSAFIDPDELSRHEAYLQRALHGETLFYRARVTSIGGRVLDMTVTTVPIYRDGTVTSVYSILRDETEQREAQRLIGEKERELADSEARLHSLFEHNPDGVLALGLDHTIIDINPAALRLGGFPREAVVGQSYKVFLPPQEHERVEELIQRALCGETVSLTIESFRIDGITLQLEATLIPQYARDVVIGAYAVLQDITERRAAERRAEMQRQRIRNLYFIAASGDYPDVRMRASLEMGCRAFDHSVGAVIDATSGDSRIDAIYRHPRFGQIEDATLLEMAEHVMARGAPGVPISFPNGVALRFDIGGDRYGALVFASSTPPVNDFSDTDADLVGLISTLIAGAIDRTRQRARLRAMAYYDALTGLPNRAYLSEKLRDAIEVAQSRLSRVAVLFLDLDRFKDVNDTLGHARGDRLLQLASSRLLKQFAERGTVARMGGDEYVVLFTEFDDVDEVRDVADAVLATMSEPFSLDEYEQFISTSIGIAMYPEDGRDDQTLIKNADIAMYRAKDRGRNGYYFYNPTLESPIHMRLSQEKLLRRALEYNEFVVYYQPQLSLSTGEIVSVEALVRWNHPKSGLIEPSHFIPSAEISGLIVPLGDWVLATAARQIKAWQAQLGELRLAVNLSGRQFHQRDLRKALIAAIAQADLDPHLVEMEITETVAMSDAAQTVAIVRDLKSSGIRTAVDDFGTGYSSLAYLRRFSLDVLKIDRSFVLGIGHEASDETIVKTVIGMAQSLGLEVVAEGVETDEQLQFLRQHKCDLIQGHVLAPAMPAERFEAFMLDRRNRASPLA